MTPLEALHSFDHWIQVEFAEQFKIIEKALKDYEELKIVAKPLTNEEKKSINSVAKRLKALEIIKENFNFETLEISRPSYTHYIFRIVDKEIPSLFVTIITKDKSTIDLLKEVLK